MKQGLTAKQIKRHLEGRMIVRAWVSTADTNVGKRPAMHRFELDDGTIVDLIVNEGEVDYSIEPVLRREK